MRGTWLAVAFGLAFGAPAWAADSVKKTFDAAGIKKLALEQASGKVEILGTDAKTATVTATKGRFDDACELSMATKGSELVVRNKEPSLDFNRKCQVDFKIEVPKQVAMDLKVGAGDVTIDGVKGTLEYKLGNGDLRVKDADLAEVDGKSGSGDVEIAGHVGDAELKIGAGNAKITLDRAPAKGKLDVKVGTGNATIALPKDAKVKSTFKAGLGSLTNEFGDSADAQFTISGSAGTGDMTIRKL